MKDQNEIDTDGQKSVEEGKCCGIVMPISSMDGIPASHWQEVKGIIERAVLDAGFKPRLVSDADDSGVIQKRIIHNLYHDEIVVCDVSAKNPNVMFELGLRLAFDRPTIIIKDDRTDYSFDTSVIEHINYPRDLRHGLIEKFKDGLKQKIQATHSRLNDEDYTTFLGHFGEFKVASIEQKELGADAFIISELKSISRRLDRTESFIKSASQVARDSEGMLKYRRDKNLISVDVIGYMGTETEFFEDLVEMGVADFVYSINVNKIHDGFRVSFNCPEGVDVEGRLRKTLHDHFSDKYILQY